jgi:hypothetical protein
MKETSKTFLALAQRIKKSPGLRVHKSGALHRTVTLYNGKRLGGWNEVHLELGTGGLGGKKGKIIVTLFNSFGNLKEFYGTSREAYGFIAALLMITPHNCVDEYVNKVIDGTANVSQVSLRHKNPASG